jgi:hypothetical protein
MEKKLPEVNNRLMGENSSNLVTLVLKELQCAVSLFHCNTSFNGFSMATMAFDEARSQSCDCCIYNYNAGVKSRYQVG